MKSHETTVVGFDSAWTDRTTAPGAVCALRRRHGGGWHMGQPELALFADALRIIRDEADDADRCLVAIDQPTIVPNTAGSRPVEKVAASLVSFIGGGVQPANRSKIGMFDDGAPVWRFLNALQATDDPDLARTAAAGLYVMEVFPALALPTLEPSFHARSAGARYNPQRRRRYLQEHWHRVVTAVSTAGEHLGIGGIVAWAERHRNIEHPRKSDQDLLDAVICAVVGVWWLVEDRSKSIVIGDRTTGYMIAPVSADVRARLTRAAAAAGVPVDGIVPIAR